MSQNFTNKFSIAENLFKEGRYSDAINEIDEILSDRTIHLKNKVASKYLKTHTLIKQKKHNEALELAEKIISTGLDKKDNVFQVDGFLAKAAVKTDLRETKESFNLVSKAEKILKSSSQLTGENLDLRSSEILRLKGWGYLQNGQLKEALESFKNRIDLCRTAKITYDLGVSFNDTGIALMYSGEFQEALKFFNQGLEIFREMGNKRHTANLYNNIAIIHYQRGELNQALEISGKCLALREELGEEYDISAINHQLGYIYSQLGNLDKALEHYMKSNETYKKKNIYIDQARALLDIHYVYKRKGEFTNALEYLDTLLELNKEKKDYPSMGITHNYIGRIYVEKGELDIAEQNYKKALNFAVESKEEDILSDVYYSLGELAYFKSELEDSLKYHLLSLEIREKIGYPFHKAFSLKNLVVLHLDLSLIEKAKEYQTKLNKLSDTSENLAIKQISKLCEALVLRTTKSSKDNAKAEFLLEQIVTDEILDYLITVEALFNLTDMLLDELSKTENEELLHEISEKIEKLEEIAYKQGSLYLITEISLLQSQLLLLNLDIKGALQVLKSSQELAELKGLHRIGLKLSNEYDNILDKIDLWEKFTMRLPSIAEKMELLHIEEHLDNLIKRRQVDSEELKSEEEIPLLLSLLSSEGSVLFIDHIDEMLPRDMLNVIFQEVRETKLSKLKDLIIERYRVDDYTYLLLKREKIIICYIFIGKSYLAEKKMDKFNKKLFKQTNIDNIIKKDAIDLETSKRTEITKLIDEVFLKK